MALGSKRYGVGIGQTWQNMTGSRAASTTYYNTTGKPILVSIKGFQSTQGTQALTVDGVAIASQTTVTNGVSTLCAIVPVGSSYSWTHNGASITVWAELRD